MTSVPSVVSRPSPLKEETSAHDTGAVLREKANPAPTTIDVYGKPSRKHASSWPPVEMRDARGTFVVHPRPPKTLWLEPWEKSHCLVGLTSALAAVAVARGVWTATTLGASGLHATAVASSSSLWLSMLQVGVGMGLIGAAATYVQMLPERKQGPNHDETDPRLLPRYDFHCDWLETSPVPWEKIQAQHHEPAAVSRNILQAWFGNKAKLAGRDAQWRDYAETFGYKHLFVTEDNLQSLLDSGEIALSENNRKILAYEFDHQNWWSVSDLVRYGWLIKNGGIYADIDMNPPRRGGQLIDMMDVVKPQGLTLITEEFGRDVGARNGAYVFNGFLATPPNDPTIQHFCDILPRTWAAANRHARSEYTHGGIRDAFAAFSTGPFPFNRIFRGCTQLLPFRDAAELGIVNASINDRSYGLRLWTENHV